MEHDDRSAEKPAVDLGRRRLLGVAGSGLLMGGFLGSMTPAHAAETRGLRWGVVGTGGTPDIRPGDRIVVTAGTARNEVTVDDIRWTGAPELAANGDVVIRGVAIRADGTVIPPAVLDSGEFRNESGKYRATPDAVEADPGVHGGFVVRYRAPYLGFRNSDGLTETQRKQALLTEDGHAIGIGHTEPLPRESMLVDGLADVTGPAVGCENFSQDLLPPKPVSQTPAPETRDVGRLSNVTVGFDEPVTGLSSSTFTLSASNGTAVTAGVAYNRTTGVATLNPFPGTTDPLAAGTRYTATVSETVTDAAGNPLPKTSWSFVTSGEGPDNDRTAPTVASRTPESGATGVARGANVLVGISEAVAKPDADVGLAGRAGRFEGARRGQRQRDHQHGDRQPGRRSRCRHHLPGRPDRRCEGPRRQQAGAHDLDVHHERDGVRGHRAADGPASRPHRARPAWPRAPTCWSA